MKYIDPITKEKKTIYTKASDTLPLGAIVDFDGEEIPAGWEPAPEDATVYIGPNEPTDGQDIWIQKGKNLFDKNAVVIGWLNEDGSINYEATYRTSTFIKVAPNTTYYKTITNSVRAKFYDKDKNPLTNSYSDLSGSGDFAFTTPDNAYYLRVTLTADYLDTLQIEFGDKPTEYEPYIDKKIYIKNEIGKYDLVVKNKVHIGPYQPENGEDVWIKKSKNLYNKNGYTGFTYPSMYPTGKTELQASGYLRSTSNYYSGYSPGQLIKVEKNTDYTLSLEVVDREVEGTTIVAMGYKSSAGTYGAFYTKSFKNNIGRHVFNFNTGDNTDIIVSINGVFNSDGKQQWIDYDKVQLEKGTPSSIEYEPYSTEKIFVKNVSGIYTEFVKEGVWEEAQYNDAHTKITVPINWDELKEISIRTLGTDQGTFAYLTVPKEHWHNDGGYALQLRCVDANNYAQGYGNFTVTEKGNNYFVITKSGTSGSVQILYKRK